MRIDGSNQPRAIFVGLALLVLVIAGHRCAGEEKKVNSEVKASVALTKPDGDGKQTISLTIHIKEGWYIYANPVKNAMEIYQKNQTVVRVSSQGKLGDVKLRYPAGKQHEEFGQKFMIYDEKVTIEVVVQRVVGDGPLEIDLLVNTCNLKHFCLPKAEVRFTLP